MTRWGEVKCSGCDSVFQILMNAAPFLACAMAENALTLPVATSAPVREVTSPPRTDPDVWVSHPETNIKKKLFSLSAVHFFS